MAQQKSHAADRITTHVPSWIDFPRASRCPMLSFFVFDSASIAIVNEITSAAIHTRYQGDTSTSILLREGGRKHSQYVMLIQYTKSMNHGQYEVCLSFVDGRPKFTFQQKSSSSVS